MPPGGGGRKNRTDCFSPPTLCAKPLVEYRLRDEDLCGADLGEKIDASRVSKKNQRRRIDHENVMHLRVRARDLLFRRRRRRPAALPARPETRRGSSRRTAQSAA